MQFRGNNSSSNNFTYSLHPENNKLSKYIVGKEIGKGAYATVKAIVDKETKEKLAMKVYDKFKLFDKSKKATVLREIQVMKRINHKNIVKLIEVINTERQVICYLYNNILDSSYYGICKGDFSERIL